MKYIISIFLLSLLLGCQTTEVATPKLEQQLSVVPKEPKDGSRGPKDELDKLEQQMKDTKKKKAENPFAGHEIAPNLTVTSQKPVVCGRIDIILTNMQNRFGEIPVFVGKSESATPLGKQYHMVTLTYNQKTKTFTFFSLDNFLI